MALESFSYIPGKSLGKILTFLPIWNENKDYLLDTCLFAQNEFKKHLDYFQIPYDEY